MIFRRKHIPSRRPLPGTFTMSLVWLMIAVALPLFGQQERKALTEGWMFHKVGSDRSLSAQVPGSIHLDLLAHDLIPDPFYRNNAYEMGWVDSAAWTYSLRMPWPQAAIDAERTVLVFEGLDTYADVFIDGELRLAADNMFRTWHIDLSGLDKSRELDIHIVFYPAIFKGAERARAAGIRYPADSDPFDWKPSVHTRKAPYQWGWDFAPSLPGCGIWRPVYLEWGSGPRLQDVWLETTHLAEGVAGLRLNGSVVHGAGQHWHLHWSIGELTGHATIRAEEAKTLFSIPVEMVDPLLWWPSGEGKAHLYPVVVRLSGSEVEDSICFRTGIRTVELDQSPDAWGTAFQFVVNGRPVFVKGANWVPADMFPARVDAERYRFMLGAAAEANMNMLRVWGGGIYESDLFYELADSLGLMVWQDFMFAGTMYPGDEAFLENVAAEVGDQVRRLRHHASLVLWCGNNEIAVAWKHWGWSATYGYDEPLQRKLEADYRRLFEELIPAMVSAESPGVDYIPSSPVSNWGDPDELMHGSSHFWGVWHGEMALDSLRSRVPRFMAEYGMQSFPAWKSIERFSQPEDWSDTSSVMQGRQRSYKGNGLLRQYIEMEGLTHPADFRGLVVATHEVQGRALDTAIRAHIATQPFCMGTLFWQFNEPWPGLSWSVIDYYGHKKPAYEVVRRAYSMVE